MILRPWRRCRELQIRLDVLERVLSDERRYDLRDAIALAASMHKRMTDQRAELDGLDESLRLLSESFWQRKFSQLEVGQ